MPLATFSIWRVTIRGNSNENLKQTELIKSSRLARKVDDHLLSQLTCKRERLGIIFEFSIRIRLEHFAIFEKLVSAITSKRLRIITDHVEMKIAQSLSYKSILYVPL